MLYTYRHIIIVFNLRATKEGVVAAPSVFFKRHFVSSRSFLKRVYVPVGYSLTHLLTSIILETFQRIFVTKVACTDNFTILVEHINNTSSSENVPEFATQQFLYLQFFCVIVLNS